MFSFLKKSKTLRSILGAATLFTAGVPSEVEGAPKPPQKMTQAALKDCDLLAQEYRPLCEQLEGNLPYFYYGKTGKMTVGCGVHAKDFKAVQNLTVLKVTPKKGKKFTLNNKARLIQIANANWQDPKTKQRFPEVEKVEKIRVKNCFGKCPKNVDKLWEKPLFLMPTNTLTKINDVAIQFHVKNAYKCHPNLFSLPPSLRLVVLDLIYNLGYEKYKKTFPKFQRAVWKNDLWQARKESSLKGNPRRTDAHIILIDSARLCSAKCMQVSVQKTFDELKMRSDKRKSGCMQSSKEVAFWATVATCTGKNHSWYKMENQRHFLQSSMTKITK